MESKEKAIIDLVKELGMIRIKDLIERGIHPEYARRLFRKGVIIQATRGLYVLSNADITENHTLAMLAKRIPKGVICLTSSLLFHDIGTQLPWNIWLALEKGSALPRPSYPPISVVRFSDRSFTEGVEEHLLEGVPVKIYNPAKTVADCFKFRNRLGLDVALEAAKDCLSARKATISEIYGYSKICRVANVMKPYLEALQ